MDELGEFLRNLDSVWIYPAGALSVALSAVLPPAPSTTLFVALGSLSVSSDQLNPFLLAASMFAGAMAGDLATFLLVRHFRINERNFFSGPRWQAAFRSAGLKLRGRGLPIVLTSRFIPLGRLSLNVAAAVARQPLRSFAAHSALAALLWSTYAVGVGALSGSWPELSTEFAVLLAIAVSLVLGRLINYALAWWENRGQLEDANRHAG
ncbi:membrane protein DedA family [Arthrobacter crystallopoietes BAB-32]|uniref:Membrane protein DedA family n=1 Tax=Arthrobacter crystallopoietes BAB-32 TaxID=1246476 RepID=N1UVI9_9MICC|nr:VTT domain-containing protein [Arthrobacter crystallopoietes]EMY34421.1 membrane protein DedA family [Arthrobacter crystallopoietes BAB-32]